MVQVNMKKPAAVIFDFSGTAARESFVEKQLMPYFKVAYKAYFEANWSKPECQEDVKALAVVANRDGGAPKIDTSAPKSDQISSLAKYIEYCGEKKKESSKAFVMYRFHVWFDGYERGKIQTPVFSDVAVLLQKWHMDLGIKLYIMSNGWAEATKRFMKNTSHGDLASIIEAQFDTTLGALTDPGTWKKVVEKIGKEPADIVFLTKSPAEAKCAKSAGLNVIMVITHSASVEAAEKSKSGIPIARTFTQIEFTN